MENIKKIGMFLTCFSDRYQAAVWAGACQEVKKRGGHLVCIRGERLHSPNIYEKPANILYDLIRKENLEGLIILSNSVGTFCTTGELEEFFRRYREIPLVSVGYRLQGIPCITLDNARGMTELVSHLTDIHGHKKFLFIAGPSSHRESEIRIRAYCDLLRSRDIDPEKQLFYRGDFSQEAGNLAINHFGPVVLKDLDAVIASNDNMAFGAMEQLRELGFSIPEDIAVTGFDDTEDCLYAIPTITTVRQPHVQAGRQAVKMLLEKNESQETLLSSTLKVRESCGCLSRFFKMPPLGEEVTEARSLKEAIEIISAKPEWHLLIESEFIKNFTIEAIEKIEQSQNSKESGLFFSFWQSRLRHPLFSRPVMRTLNEFLGEIILRLQNYYSGKEELLFLRSLLYQGREYLLELEARKRAGEHLEYEKMFVTLENISTRLMSTLEETDLKKIITDCMKNLKIPRFYLILYENPGTALPEWSRLVYYFQKNTGKDLGTEGLRFRTREILPSRFRSQSGIFIMEALYIQEQQLGYFISETGPFYGEIYDTLRLKLSTALHSLNLVNEVRDHAKKLEREVIARTADLVQSNEELTYQIAQRQKYETALEESERTLRALTDAIPVPLAIMKSGNMEILYKNAPFKLFFKESPGFFDYIPSPGKIEAISEQLEEEGAIPELELKLRGRGRKSLWMIATFRRIAFRGEDAVIVGLNDISGTKKLQQKVLEINEGVQRTIGLDLHDDICQNLAGISVMTTVISNMVKDTDAVLFRNINEIGEMINNTIDDIAHIARGLYPADLEGNGISFALLQAAKQAERQFHRSCRIDIDEEIRIADRERQLHFFRIGQELIYNAFKHSGGSEILASLKESKNRIYLTVEDNGIGFQWKKRKSYRMGLVSIMYRAQLIDGELEFIPRAGGGTIARCTIFKETNEKQQRKTKSNNS